LKAHIRSTLKTILESSIGLRVNKKRQNVSLGVVAKYSVYSQAIRKELINSECRIYEFPTFSELEKSPIVSDLDFIFFPHVSEILPTKFITKFNCIGFHTGDLPANRGGSPIQHKILSKEYLTKVSAFKITDRLDSGPIYLQKDIDLSKGDLGEMINRIAGLVAEIVSEMVKTDIIPTPQIIEGEPRKRLGVEAGEIDFLNLDLNEIYDRIRMLDGYDYPRAHAYFGKYKLYFSKATYQENCLTFDCRIENLKNAD